MLRISALARKLLAFFELQLFISLICIPILAYWGLPISCVSPMSNLIFTPFLTIFLLISSLLFFCTLLSIPCGLLGSLLNSLSIIWLKLMAYGSSSWLISFISPHYYSMLGLLGIIVAIHYYIQQFERPIRVTTLFILLGLLCLSLKLQAPQEKTVTVAAPRGTITVTVNNGFLELIDHSCFTGNPENFAEFTLLNQLRKEFGTTSIDSYVIHKPTITSFKIARALNKLCSITSIAIPYWKEDNKKLAYEFIHLKKSLPSTTRIKRIRLT